MLPRSGTSRLLRFTLLPFFIIILVILVSSASRAFAQEPASPTLPAGEVLVVRAGDLWLLNLANDDAIQLTDSGDAKWPSWSPDGSKFMYTRATAQGDELWEYHIDSGNNRLVLTQACCGAYSHNDVEIAIVNYILGDSAVDTYDGIASHRLIETVDYARGTFANGPLVWGTYPYDEETILVPVQGIMGSGAGFITGYEEVLVAGLHEYVERNESRAALNLEGTCGASNATYSSNASPAVAAYSFSQYGSEPVCPDSSVLVSEAPRFVFIQTEGKAGGSLLENLAYPSLSPDGAWLAAERYSESEFLNDQAAEGVVLVNLATSEETMLDVDGVQPAWRPLPVVDAATPPANSQASLDAESGSILLAAGHESTCAAVGETDLYCWGRNQQGQLGNRTLVDQAVPTHAELLFDGVKDLSVGDEFACAIDLRGNIVCWGENNGKYGNGGVEPGDNLASVSGSKVYISVGAGYSHACGLTREGQVQCWGANQRGQLGNGTTDDSLSPVDVIGLGDRITAISVGYDHTCAIDSRGRLYCWGWNEYGQLGDGAKVNRNAPVQVSGASSGVAAVAAGDAHTCLLTNAGGVKCWGGNASGQAGDSSRIERLAPVNVYQLQQGVQAISAGRNHTCALTTGGAVKCWGANDGGRIGDGTSFHRYVPTQVKGLESGVVAVSAGGYHTCAVTDANQIRCWGANWYGQLGDGTTFDRATPVLVSSPVSSTSMSVLPDIGGGEPDGAELSAGAGNIIVYPPGVAGGLVEVPLIGLYATPSFASQPINTLNMAQPVGAIARSTDSHWVFITTMDGHAGWVPASAIAWAADPHGPAYMLLPTTVTVIIQAGPVRQLIPQYNGPINGPIYGPVNSTDPNVIYNYRVDMTGVVNTASLNLRSGPGTSYPVVSKLPLGLIVIILQSTSDGEWYWVWTSTGSQGWVSAQYVRITNTGDVSPSGSTGPAAVPAHVVVPAATAVPVPQPTPCLITVDSRLADLWNRTSLGCPTGNAFLTWASWTPYERGQIVWRLDTNRVYGFFNSGWWKRFEEQWDEVSVGPSRGPTPQGLFEPTRGTGWLWRTNDTMYNELGWARDDQHGFCALVQNFDNGFVVRSNMIEFCQDNLYNTAREGDWPLDSIVAINNGNWSLRYR